MKVEIKFEDNSGYPCTNFVTVLEELVKQLNKLQHPEKEQLDE